MIGVCDSLKMPHEQGLDLTMNDWIGQRTSVLEKKDLNRKMKAIKCDKWYSYCLCMFQIMTHHKY